MPTDRGLPDALRELTEDFAVPVAVTAEISPRPPPDVEVVDDGCGGADPEQGSGLTGLADRIAAVDGKMLLSSPLGGPTVVRVELPWIEN